MGVMSSRLLLHGSLVTLALLLPALVGVACGTTERLNPADFSPPDGGTSTSSSATSTGATGSGGAGGASSTTTTTATTSAGGGNGGNGGATSSSGVGGSGGSVASSTAGVGGGASGSGGAGGMGSGAAASGSGGAGGVGSAAGTTASSTSAASTSGAGGSGGGGPVCNTVETNYPVAPSPHVAECSAVAYGSVPPTSGPHYPYWAAFKTYSAPIPAGYWVHSLEHGAVVILYNCPNGCDAELAALDAYLAAIPADPLCVPPLAHRYIVVPDPTLPFTFAAAAWGNGLTSSCFDLPALGAFISAHYAMAPENFCFQGTDLEALDGGIPCGSIDAGADGG
jgi:hypothetical protein